MPFNTLTVGAAVTPAIVETYISHFLNRKPLHQKPTAHISYHEGLTLIRRFLNYGANHTVEELQAFSAQWVPAPRWVKVNDITIDSKHLHDAAELLQAELGPKGIERVGGKLWWQWRRGASSDAARATTETPFAGGSLLNSPGLDAEWIEMRSDYNARKKSNNPKGSRVILYVHGGAYFFGSVDAHRYQMQRHARKLKARVLAPRYRLAPQFPFPCGLQDCLAAYLFLLAEGHDPATILLAGDSAGAGMVLSTLVCLRDQGIPLPAGGILISPWVDLTHSFKSLLGDGKLDYIPAHGFQHKPSMSWPPPNADDIAALETGLAGIRLGEKSTRERAKEEDKSRKDIRSEDKEVKRDRARGYTEHENEPPQLDIPEVKEPSRPGTAHSKATSGSVGLKENMTPKPGENLKIKVDGKIIEIKDQVQLYAANDLLNHPLVSPVLQPTLGGLPPLLVQSGSGELLTDEQVYLAHKAANPRAYLPSEDIMNEHDHNREKINKWSEGTDVQLQLWEDLCHVATTLAWTRPAKYMFRSIAQYGAWALARAQHTAIDILDDDDISIISSSTSGSSSSASSIKKQKKEEKRAAKKASRENLANGHDGVNSSPPDIPKILEPAKSDTSEVGRAGDSLPPFVDHMIRQQVTRHGTVRALAPASELQACQQPADEIGIIKPGPVQKWLKVTGIWAKKFHRDKAKVQKRRLHEMREGYVDFGPGEKPSPTALAGRRRRGVEVAAEKRKKGWGLGMWTRWGGKHDMDTITREEKADQHNEQAINADGVTRAISSADAEREKKLLRPKSTRSRTHSQSRSRSRHSRVSSGGQRYRTITDEGQAGGPPTITTQTLTQPIITVPSEEEGVVTLIPSTTTNSVRPFNSSTLESGGEEVIAFPFKVSSKPLDGAENASVMTLESRQAISPGVDKMFSETEAQNLAAVNADSEQKAEEKKEGEIERPQAERFYTATDDA